VRDHRDIRLAVRGDRAIAHRANIRAPAGPDSITDTSSCRGSIDDALPLVVRPGRGEQPSESGLALDG
jgi:hypothetical protein